MLDVKTYWPSLVFLLLMILFYCFATTVLWTIRESVCKSNESKALTRVLRWFFTALVGIGIYTISRYIWIFIELADRIIKSIPK